jgi:hypothetical protein
MAEEWKDIPGYEGKYQASTLGRIRSLDRRVRLVAHGKETTRLMRGRVLRPGKYDSIGHVSVVLGHKAIGSPVHYLIALTFIGPRPKGMDVCHNDGDPTNNAVSNLRYDTRTENNRDIYRQGQQGARTSLEKVDQIQKMLAGGMTGAEVSRTVSLSQTQVSRIKLGRTYGWYKTEK